MDEVVNLNGPARTASAVVWTWAATDVVASIVAVFAPSPNDAAYGLTEWAFLAALLMQLACAISVGRWIYLASSNAHLRDSRLTISPGWAVGWYFVPIACVWKPFEAMREIWREAHGEDPQYAPSSPDLSLWWALWLGVTIGPNVASIADGRGTPWVGFAVALLSPILAFQWIKIMREVSNSQSEANYVEVFA